MSDKQSRAETESGANPTRLRLPLATIEDCRRELARVYREAKSRRRDVQEASKLAYMLHLLARMIEESTLEARIEALEGRQSAQEVPPWGRH